MDQKSSRKGLSELRPEVYSTSLASENGGQKCTRNRAEKGLSKLRPEIFATSLGSKTEGRNPPEIDEKKD